MRGRMLLLLIILACLLPTMAPAQSDISDGPFFIRLDPADGTVITTPEIVITGAVTDPTAQVTLQDAAALHAVTINSNPKDFAFKVTLNPGINTFQINASAKFGKTSSEIIEVIFVPATSGDPGPLSVSPDTPWMIPNVASVDMLDLFTDQVNDTCQSLPIPDNWKEARATIKVFGFYRPNTESTSCGGICGQNTLSNLRTYKAFCKLNSSGIKIALASSVLVSNDCTGVGNIAGAKASIGNIQTGTAGAPVTYVDMDSPWLKGKEDCQLSMSVAADRTKNFIDSVIAQYPNVKIGLTEPYPNFLVPEIKDWIDALIGKGVSLPFFHLDVDVLDPGYHENNYKTALQDLKQICLDRGIVFGVILDGVHNSQSDCTFVNGAKSLTNTTKQGIGIPEHSLFMSFANAPGGSIPHNLTECGTCTLSRLVNDGWWNILQGLGNNSAFVSQVGVPTQIAHGQQFTVTITMRNTGGPSWTSTNYSLVPTAGNNFWGVNQVFVPNGKCVPPNLTSDYTAAFTFTATAPATPGTYGFQWKMQDESSGSGIKFGAATTKKNIVVN